MFKPANTYLKLHWLACLAGLVFFVSFASANAATSYDSMLKQLRMDSARRPDSIHLFQIGISATGKRDIWMVRVSSATSPESPRLRPRLLFICRQHGDEPVSTEAAIQFISRAAKEDPAALNRQLESDEVYIIPMANPDGAGALTRLNGVGGDLNRDWGKFTQPETRAIFSAFKQVKPYAVIDMHSWTPGDSFLSNSVEVPAGNASLSSLITMDNDLQTRVIAEVRHRTGSAPTAFCFAPSSDLTLCHRFFATKENIVSMLIETAPPSPDTGGVAGRLPMAMTAFDVITDSMAANKAPWNRVATVEGVTMAPANAFTADYGGLNDAERLAIRAEQRLGQRQRRNIYISFLVYAAAMVVLISFLGRNAWDALLRLLARIDVAYVNNSYVYVKCRYRHFANREVKNVRSTRPANSSYRSSRAA